MKSIGFKKSTIKSIAIGLGSALMIGALFLSQNASAQNHSVLYDMNADVKQYVVKSDPNNPDECAMAGTIMTPYYWMDKREHFMRLDAQGNVLVSKVLTWGTEDERVVDIVPVTDPYSGIRYWYVVSLVRSGGLGGATTIGDFIRITAYDDAGNRFDHHYYYVNNGAQQLYPKDATIWTDPNTQEMQMYICGYTTVGTSTVYPAEPDYTSDKRAFVLAVHMTFAALHEEPIKAAQYDWGSVNGYDYDMAMNIEVISATNQLHVTGSVSGINAGGSNARSATMNLVLDPTQPTTIPIVSDNPFVVPVSGEEGQGPHNYGQDLIQDGGNYYLLCNVATEGIAPWNNPTPTPPSSMYPRANHNWDIVPLDASFNPLTRWYFASTGHNWARNALLTPGGDYVIATMLASTFNTCLPSPPGLPGFFPYYDNVVPTLISIQLNGVNKPVVTGSHVFMTTNGTGDPATTTNNYYTMGGALSLVDYEPTFADVGSTQFMISAPRTLSSTGNLGLKYMNPDLSFNIDCSEYTCYGQFFETDIAATDPGQELPLDIIVHAPVVPGVGNLPVTQFNPCQDDSGGTGYKPTALKDVVVATADTRIYPNPTTGVVYVSLAKGISDNAQVQVRMTNIYGQDIGNLYTGTAFKLRAGNSLLLPAKASGLYFIYVYADGELVSKEKLMVK